MRGVLRSPRPSRGGGGSLCLAAALASMWLASPADASAPASWRSLAHDVAVSWSKLQNRNGTFRDYVYGGDVSFCYRRRCRPGLGNARYAESVLGYAMIKTGLREHDMHLVDSG